MHSVCNCAGLQHFCHIAACSAWVPGTMLDHLDREEEPSPSALPWLHQTTVIPLYSVTAVTARVKSATILFAGRPGAEGAIGYSLTPHLQRGGRRTRSPSRNGRVPNPDRGKSGSVSHLAETVNSQEKRGFSSPGTVAPRHFAVCIVGFTRLRPGVHQPDPPGLIHDDPRLLPPWRGSSFFVGLSSVWPYWRSPPGV